jgi:peptidoglycan/LPS O-acetylase OafA/YrhL
MSKIAYARRMDPRPEHSALDRRPIFDGVRGLAIIMVLIFHSAVIKPQGRLDDFYSQLCHSLWIGVDLFFVLSGFLITHISFDSKGSKNY